MSGRKKNQIDSKTLLERDKNDIKWSGLSKIAKTTQTAQRGKQ